jgi:phosphoribosylanthranilate isomerase
MIVQIYEVADRAEAVALAALGVDHVGVLVGSGKFPRELAPAAARAIFEALPAATRRVALALSADPNEIARAIDGARPDILHLGAATEHLTADQVRALKARHPGLPIMRSIPVVGPESLAIAQTYETIADFLLLDSHVPGDRQIGAVGRTHDWTVSRRIVETVAVPAILAGGLGPDNVGAAIRAVRPFGVDSKTRTDRADGAGKDRDAVARFVAAARLEGHPPG